MSIADGWMDVERIPTAAAGGYIVQNGEMWPKQVISHVMQGYQSTMLQWATERPSVTRASAHFTIGRNGRIVQHVSIWTPAWHVAWKDYNVHSIGIEHEGFSVAPSYGYDYLYTPQTPWPEALIESTLKVHKWVFEAIQLYDPAVKPDESTIITHSMTGQPDRAQDPGDLWMTAVRPRILAAFLPPVPPALDLTAVAAARDLLTQFLEQNK